MLLFADDTTVLLHDSDINHLTIRANKALLDISHWFKLNKLSVNVKKCNFIIFATKQLNADIEIFLDNCQLEKVRQTKFL